ncbi:MAG: DUF4270 domain-containing protein [Bacteroidales bacterium]
MKIKFLPIIAALALAFVACDDTLSNVGSSIQPSEDQLEVFTDTLGVDGTTILVDSIYARTYYGLLGTYTDKEYGTISSDFLCQYYCPKGLIERNDSLVVSIDSMKVEMLYAKSGSWLGDPNAPMGVTVYEVNNSLAKDFYTNTNPADFCDKTLELGATGYTVSNSGVSDSIKNEQSYIPSIRVPLSQNLVSRFSDEYFKNGKKAFMNPQSFNDFFKGTYISNSYGEGAIVNVSETRILLYYTYKLDKKGDDHVGKLDSTAASNATLLVTEEIIQMNNIQNSNMDNILSPENNKTRTFVKSPAGVVTQIQMPLGEMIEKVQDAQVNSLRLQFGVKPNKESNMKAPPYLLMIPASEVSGYFEADKLPDGKTSFVARYDSISYTYTFSNIGPFVKEMAKKYEEQGVDIKNKLESVHLIPVAIRESQDPYTGTSTIEEMANYFGISGIELLKQEFEGGYKFKTSLVWSQYKEK